MLQCAQVRYLKLEYFNCKGKYMRTDLDKVFDSKSIQIQESEIRIRFVIYKIHFCLFQFHHYRASP